MPFLLGEQFILPSYCSRKRKPPISARAGRTSVTPMSIRITTVCCRWRCALFLNSCLMRDFPFPR